MFDINNIDVSSLFTNNSGASILKKYDNPFARDGKKASENRIRNKKKPTRFIRYFRKKK